MTRTRGKEKRPKEDTRDDRLRRRQKMADESAKAEAVSAKKSKAVSAKKTTVAVRPWPPEASGRTWRAGGF